jgi:hypothetical protein
MTRVVDHPPAAVVFDFDFDTALRLAGLDTMSKLQWQVAGFELRRRKPTDLQSIPDVCRTFSLNTVRAGRGLGLA